MTNTRNLTAQNRHLHVRSRALLQSDAPAFYKTDPVSVHANNVPVSMLARAHHCINIRCDP